jgi:hypothetical protein
MVAVQGPDYWPSPYTYIQERKRVIRVLAVFVRVPDGHHFLEAKLISVSGSELNPEAA